MTSVEYLTISEKPNTFCDSVVTFNKLLQVDSSLIISDGKIKYKDNFTCAYKVTSGEIPGKEQRYFHTQFSIESESDEDLIEFSEFLKIIRTILSKIGSPPETLWDDISFHYSKIAYNVIHKIENLMRKLIANFMLITIGIKWVNETTPAEIKEVISKGKRQDYINVLHNVDFVHLADFLIKPYSNTSQTELNKLIKTCDTIEDIQTLKNLLPESNWNRYFSSLVNCEDTFLQKRWLDLYELRCKVAHNAIISRQDSIKISSLALELEEKLTDALTKLPQLKVPEDEVTNIATNAAASTNSLIGDFVLAFGLLENKILSLAKIQGHSIENVSQAAGFLESIGILEKKHLSKIRLARMVRNELIHSPGNILDGRDIGDTLLLINDVLNSLK